MDVPAGRCGTGILLGMTPSGSAASPGRAILTGGDPRLPWPSSHEHALVRLPYLGYGRDASPKSASRPT